MAKSILQRGLTMKNGVIATALALSMAFATAAMAKDVTLQGCTKDGKTATV